MTYYSYVCEGFSGSDLNSMEKDIKEIEPEFIIIPNVEYEVSYKNFSGTGRAMTISDSGFEKLGKSYGNKTDYFLCLISGRIPEDENEVVTFLGYMVLTAIVMMEKKLKKLLYCLKLVNARQLGK